MASLEEIRSTRLHKLNLLKEKGIEPYPLYSRQDMTLLSAIENFDSLAEKTEPTHLVGRVLSFRPQGALSFLNFSDGTATFQAFLKKEDMDTESFDFFHEVVDIGDFIEFSGTFFTTKTGQKTLLVSGWKMLAKSLRPLPEKWHGLQDVEERFRRRYLDTLMSPETRERFIIRSKVITEIRSLLNNAEYLEVDTPALQELPGGASAEPFVTHHNALDVDMYLRIAPELYLKKLLIGGFPKVYEIARNFRNEGIDMTHNPEFTSVEFYESYSDANKQMEFVEEMFRTIVKNIFNKDTLTHNEHEINLAEKFAVVPYLDLFTKHLSLQNPEAMTLSDWQQKAGELDIQISKGDSMDKVMDTIYKKLIRPHLIQPTFIVDYPVDYLPLAKRNATNPKFVEAFQLVIGGTELVKAFSELNDPLDQKERFLEQEKNKQAGDAEAQTNDEEFIEAMEYGMPPAGGVGIGIDRLVMLLTDTRNIKEVILFPTMKPRD